LGTLLKNPLGIQCKATTPNTIPTNAFSLLRISFRSFARLHRTALDNQHQVRMCLHSWIGNDPGKAGRNHGRMTQRHDASQDPAFH